MLHVTRAHDIINVKLKQVFKCSCEWWPEESAIYMHNDEVLNSAVRASSYNLGKVNQNRKKPLILQKLLVIAVNLKTKVLRRKKPLTRNFFYMDHTETVGQLMASGLGIMCKTSLSSLSLLFEGLNFLYPVQYLQQFIIISFIPTLSRNV